jgi:Leucine-rich repeat (LRR) protein
MTLYKNLKNALKSSQNVRALKLKLTDKFLPQELQMFPELEELYIDLPELEELPSDLSGWQQLVALQITAPKLKGGLSSLFNLPKLQNLKVLNTNLEPLLLPLGNPIAPLIFLTLKNTKLQSLPEEFGNLNTLKEISLTQNLLSSLPQSFRRLTELKRLNMDQNVFKSFPESIAQMPNLHHLSIDNNLFDQEEKDRIQRVFHISL